MIILYLIADASHVVQIHILLKSIKYLGSFQKITKSNLILITLSDIYTITSV